VSTGVRSALSSPAFFEHLSAATVSQNVCTHFRLAARHFGSAVRHFGSIRRTIAPMRPKCARAVSAFSLVIGSEPLTNLPIRSLDKLSLNAKLREIGALEGATKPRPEVA
jgi:hypothetical protein